VRTATARAPGGTAPAEFVPYIFGATLGAPSAGRPEKVLARLKTIGSIWREGYVPGEDGREGRITAKGSLPRTPRNGLPEPGGYQYKGSGESLTAWAAERKLTRGGDAPVARPAPRRKPEPREFCRDCGQPVPDHLVTCRTALDALPIAPPPEPEPEPAVLEAAPALEPERRCEACQYLVGTNSHKIMCGDG
jgi:hypothetical protein